MLFTMSLCLCIDVIAGKGAAFLKASSKMKEERVSEEEVQTSFLEEVEGALGEGAVAARIAEMEGLLRPLFSALPHNDNGNLGHAAVRYALHRLFVQRHGWSVKGLDPAGSAWNSSSPTGILKGQVPAYIHNLFEKRLGTRGLGVHEVAVLAATVEHLVHGEASSRMVAAFNVHGFSPMDFVLEVEADSILDTYMMSYILGEDITNKTKEEALADAEQMPEVYLHWSETQQFVRDTCRKTINGTASRSDGLLGFATLVRVAESVGAQFGHFQNVECQQLKASLLRFEDRGTGRVRLSDFYKPSLDGSWQFQESVGYLRQLGALDESIANNQRVVVANYLGSATNCIASSSFYSVCCMNECEGLMGHLEVQLKAPEVSTKSIVDLVSQLASPSVTAPRNLSQTLLRRLNEISDGNDGMVPLHGRLFSQWMHHAFPRECPYPHLSGTTSSPSPEEWTEGTGIDSTASDEEMKEYIDAAPAYVRPVAAEDIHDIMPWSQEEELLVVRQPFLPSEGQGRNSAIQGAVLFTVLGSMAVSVVANVRSMMKMSSKKSHQKFII